MKHEKRRDFLVDRVFSLFIFGRYGVLGTWLVPACILTLAFIVEWTSSWGRNVELFQRSGALVTALMVPVFGFLLGKMTMWRNYRYSQRGDADNRELLATVLRHFLARQGGLPSDFDEKLEESFKTNCLRHDADEGLGLIEAMEPMVLRSFSVVLFCSTITWGFGDLVFSKDCALC